MKLVLGSVILLALSRGQAAQSEASSDGEPQLEERTALADRQYLKALELRAATGASAKQLQRAASLAKAAAGVHIVQPGSKLPENALLPHGNFTELSPGIHVANESHAGALFLLSELYSQESNGLPLNPRASFELLKHAAALGDARAHRELGLLLAAGIYAPARNATAAVPFEIGARQWRRAFLHLYLAAAANDSVAQMALGYRHAHGLGVPKSCASAALFYQAVAEKVTEMARRPYDFPRIEKVLLSTHSSRASMPSREQELLHYQWFADMGYVDAQRAVGRLLVQGGAATADRALHYFRQAARADDADAMAHLGHLYANGIGVAASNATALKWFRMGSERGNAGARFGLGFMYLRGHGLPQDYRSAAKYLSAAAEQGHAEAWFHLGNMHLHGWGMPVSPQQAQSLFGLAAKAGHVMAQYNLAMLHLRHKGQTHCELALNRLKAVAERGPWSAVLQEASSAFMDGDYSRALLTYLKASEVGYELAQANAAWMLGRNYGLPPGHSARGYVEQGTAPSPAALAALRAHQRASQQGNVESTLAIGDAFYYGTGVSRDWPKAFQVYTAAARFRNAQAHFNLGFMHEYGAGVPEDLALAKRNYDKAKQYLPGAAAPVYVALLSLWLHSWWNALKPHLPGSLGWLWGHVFVLREPARAMSPLGTYLPMPSLGAGLEKAIEALWIVPPITNVLFQIFIRPFQGDGRNVLKADILETGMLLLLIGCLWGVVWRRMRIRSRRRREEVPPEPPQPPAPGAAGTASNPGAVGIPGSTEHEASGESQAGTSPQGPGDGGSADGSGATIADGGASAPGQDGVAASDSCRVAGLAAQRSRATSFGEPPQKRSFECVSEGLVRVVLDLSARRKGHSAELSSAPGRLCRQSDANFGGTPPPITAM